jgi:hypothetical protein
VNYWKYFIAFKCDHDSQWLLKEENKKEFLIDELFFPCC